MRLPLLLLLLAHAAPEGMAATAPGSGAASAPAPGAGESAEVVHAVPRKGPYVADVDTNRVEVRWEAVEGRNALVLGTGGTWSVRVEAVRRDGMAVAKLAGLAPDRAYRYHAELGGHPTRWQEFRTFPADATSPVSFLAFGDTRSDHAMHARVAARAASESPDFVVNTGDLVGDGRREDHWQPFFEAERALLAVTPVFPAVGNHDARGSMLASHFERYFPHHRFYEKVAGPVHLFFVDTTQAFGPGSAQARWLRERLAAARDADVRRWRIVVHHHPAFSSGDHGSNAAVQRELVPLYRESGVTLVLQGHDHVYERLESGGITYVVTGGGGAPLYRVRGMPETKAHARAHHYLSVDATADRLSVRALGIDGNVLDTFAFSRGEEEARRSGSAPAAPASRPRSALPWISVLLIGGLAGAAWWGSGRLTA